VWVSIFGRDVSRKKRNAEDRRGMSKLTNASRHDNVGVEEGILVVHNVLPVDLIRGFVLGLSLAIAPGGSHNRDAPF
jgi:hypothetical protein